MVPFQSTENCCLVNTPTKVTPGLLPGCASHLECTVKFPLLTPSMCSHSAIDFTLWWHHRFFNCLYGLEEFYKCPAGGHSEKLAAWQCVALCQVYIIPPWPKMFLGHLWLWYSCRQDTVNSAENHPQCDTGVTVYLKHLQNQCTCIVFCCNLSTFWSLYGLWKLIFCICVQRYL